MAAGDHRRTSLLIKTTMLVAITKSMFFRAETAIKMSGLHNSIAFAQIAGIESP